MQDGAWLFVTRDEADAAGLGLASASSHATGDGEAMPDLPSMRCSPGAAVPASARRRTAPSLPRPPQEMRCASTSGRRCQSDRRRPRRPHTGADKVSSSISPDCRSWACVTFNPRRSGAVGAANRKRGNARPVYCVDAWDPLILHLLRPNRCGGLRFFRGEWCRPSVPTIRRTPLKRRGCEASPFAPSQSQIAGSVGGGRLGRRGHVDVDCRFLLGRSAPAFYGCCRRGQKKARTEKRGNRAGLDLRAAGRSVRLGDATAPIRQRSMRREVT